ncbi:secretory lipase [Polyplosphaeria fusca]|uniref:Secretory lipase n=1 Tax=Polyplosphaeria fusca TaxID=682080 RepID=A0A9P4V1R8_9PLEO|nr:secretory lipase [Polyplosphaeria fusca]
MLLPLVFLAFFGILGAQSRLLQVQNNTFNSFFDLSRAQIKRHNLSEDLANNVEVALNFERTNWATGSVASDRFFKAPTFNASVPPGTLLSVEEETDTSNFTLPPNLALSRILYVSANLNGSIIPTSAYILWPWQAKSFKDSKVNVSGVPVVGWGHGTSGLFGECGPSHIRNLWYQFSAPYILALQGYAVVAPDYAGLGVNKTASGEPILHQYLASPAHANDMFYAIEAARTAFPELCKAFVTMGHSQGGGAAWAAAQRQVHTPVEGYLGTVAGSPVTDIVDTIRVSPVGYSILAARFAQGMKSVFPSFEPKDWLTEEGLKRFRLYQSLSGCNSVELQLFDSSFLFKSNWHESWYMQKYRDLTATGGRPISGPMLVLQGMSDVGVNPHIVETWYRKTCSMYPDSQIQYAAFTGVTHVPVLNAGQQIWLKWIEDRFMGVEAEAGCHYQLHKPLRAVDSYQTELAYYQQIALEDYTVA